MDSATIRTRFAPSPTGYLHIGGLRTAVYAYALAKHSQGQFLLRIEDTDQKREVPGAREKLQQILKTFGLNWDEYYVQSERVKTGIYEGAAKKLVDDGHAFYCFCKPLSKEEIKENRKTGIKFRDPCRFLSKEEVASKLATGEKPAIRLKVPDGEVVSYTDFVLRKKTSWKTDVVDDAMLLKSDGFPTYHLAVVVDDHDMKITHVLRGHDWLPSTPIHLLVYQYLGYSTPEIGHLTDIQDPSGGKLSKRKGNVSVEQFIADGYLPEALLNFVILLGWAPKDNRETYTLEDFVRYFDPNGFQKGNPLFNITKLIWFNGQYLRQKTDQELLQLIKPHLKKKIDDVLLLKIIPLAKSRISTLLEFELLTSFFWQRPAPQEQTESTKSFLTDAFSVLNQVDWSKEAIETSLVNSANTKNWNRGEYFMSLRLAIAGSKITPPLTESMLIIGREETLARIKQNLG